MATEVSAFSQEMREGAFEAKNYPAAIVAEVDVTGSRDDGSTPGFRLLATYIFGGNPRRQRIAMTAPVVEERAPSQGAAITAPVRQSGSDRARKVRSTMPASETSGTLPVPNDARVHLISVPSQRYAVIRISGTARPREVENQTTYLWSFIMHFDLIAAATAILSRYNPPWTLWFLRRNEVQLAIERPQ